MVITGWKCIAATIGVSVRTAQTMRLAHGLPVVNLTARTVSVERDALLEWHRARRCASLRDAALDGAVSGVAGDRT